MTFRSQFAQSLVDLHTQSEVDPGEVTEGQGKEVANETKSSKIVFCHYEILRSAPSRLTSSHLTQLAAVSTDHQPPLFLPVVPPVLAMYLDNYKMGGDLMQALNMTRDLEDKNTFLFGPTMLVEEGPRMVCVTEKEALGRFLKFLEDLGPNIILVGLSKKSVRVLMQKLRSQDKARFLKQVEGFSWWRRILKHSGFEDYKDLSLKEFYDSTFSPPPAGPRLTCALVAERLKQAVEKVACRQGLSTSSMLGGNRKYVKKVAQDAEEVLEVVNTYLPIPVTTFTASMMEQVDIQDES